jgi:hypothetical protein
MVLDAPRVERVLDMITHLDALGDAAELAVLLAA